MIVKKCLVCEKEFRTHHTKVGKYCSIKCYRPISNQILINNGIETRIQPLIGLDNYRGGIRKDGKGYHILRKKIREHRQVVADFIGRQISKKEVIHHIDENKLNNNLDNLILFRHTNAHTRLHLFIRRHNLDSKLFKCLSVKEVLPYAT